MTLFGRTIEMPRFRFLEINVSHFTEEQRACTQAMYDKMMNDERVIYLLQDNVHISRRSSITIEQFRHKIVLRFCRFIVNSFMILKDGVYKYLMLAETESIIQHVYGVHHLYYLRYCTNQPPFIMFYISRFVRNMVMHGLHTELWGLTDSPKKLFSLGPSDDDIFRLAFMKVSTVNRDRSVDTFSVIEQISTVWRHLESIVASNNEHRRQIDNVLDSDMNEDAQMDTLFNLSRENTINRTFDLTHMHPVSIDQDETYTRPESEDSDCGLCYACDSVYACKSCKYQMCRECLKKILLGTGKCPCCQTESFTVCVIKSSDDAVPDQSLFDSESINTEMRAYASVDIDALMNNKKLMFLYSSLTVLRINLHTFTKLRDIYENHASVIHVFDYHASTYTPLKNDLNSFISDDQVIPEKINEEPIPFNDLFDDA